MAMIVQFMALNKKKGSELKMLGTLLIWTSGRIYKDRFTGNSLPNTAGYHAFSVCVSATTGACFSVDTSFVTSFDFSAFFLVSAVLAALRDRG